VNPAIFPRVWSFFDDAMGKAVCEIKGALGPVNFQFPIYVQSLEFFNGLSIMMPSVAPHLSEAAVGKQVLWRDIPRTPARFAGLGFHKLGRSLDAHRAFVAAWVLVEHPL
jgi:hypothetical protein